MTINGFGDSLTAWLVQPAASDLVQDSGKANVFEARGKKFVAQQTSGKSWRDLPIIRRFFSNSGSASSERSAVPEGDAKLGSQMSEWVVVNRGDDNSDLTETVNLGNSYSQDLIRRTEKTTQTSHSAKVSNSTASCSSDKQGQRVFITLMEKAIYAFTEPADPGKERVTFNSEEKAALKDKWSKHTREEAEEELKKFDLRPLTPKDHITMQAPVRAQRIKQNTEAKKMLVRLGFAPKYDGNKDTVEVGAKLSFEKKPTDSALSRKPVALSATPPAAFSNTRPALPPAAVPKVSAPSTAHLHADKKSEILESAMDKMVHSIRAPGFNARDYLSSEEKLALTEKWHRNTPEQTNKLLQYFNPPARNPGESMPVAKQALRNDKLLHARIAVIRMGFEPEHDPQKDIIRVGKKITF